MLGKRLAHYEITGTLGAGGMGEVYRARDTKLDRDVALKVLPAATAADPRRLSRFTLEAKVVASLNHPNIVTLYSVDEAAGVHFLTMELVEGRSLADLLPPDGYPLDRLIDLGAAIADALSAAHDRGIVHRDLKPSNVMVADDGDRVKVLDFGLAKLNAPEPGDDSAELNTLTATQAGIIIGTPHYMAPEQTGTGEVDQRADLFALGVMLYEMATGARPFQGESTIELLSSVLRDDPQPMTAIRSDVPPRLESIIRRCLVKDPAGRYASAAALAADLRDLKTASGSGSRILPVGGAGHPDSAPPSWPATAAGVAAPPWWRRPAGIAGLGAVLVLAVVAAVALVRVSGPAGPRSGTDGSGRVVAILPFENLGHTDDAYFAAGITDEITSRLVLIEGLDVISQSSTRTYAESELSSQEIGRDLGVDYILEGTIRWDRTGGPGHVVISPRLILVSEDKYVWSDSYEREVTEIFALQAEIAARVAEALNITLLEATGKALNERPTENFEAYQAYLRGMQQLNAPGFGREAFASGLQQFERAVALDEDFAVAHARLSAMNARFYHYGFDRTPARLERARQAGERALALQPDLPEAHLAVAYYHYWGKRDYDRALLALEEARRLAPNMGEVLLATAYVKRRQGDFAAGVRFLERYRRLSPRDPNVFVALGETYGVLRRYRDAKESYEQARVLQPDDPYSSTELALVHLRWTGDPAAARAALNGAPSLAGSEGCRVGYLTELFARDYAAALAVLDSCPDAVLEAGAFYTPVDLLRGFVHRLAGETELAQAAFDSAREQLVSRLQDAPDDPRLHGALGLAEAGLGRAADAVRHGRRAVELQPLSRDALEAPVHIINLALILTTVDQDAESLAQLDLLLSMPSILSTTWLEKDPRWDGLRDADGYTELMTRYADERPGG